MVDRGRGSRPEAEPERPASAPPERYEVGCEIARGGMGRVVEAFDTKLGRTVAVKEALADSDDALRRFRREIRITARLEHPSIVPIHDAGESANGSPFYVMRKVSGRPLEELVLEADTLAKRLALLPNLVATANAIAHAHRRGVIHRDIKPTNILIGDLGETVVIDWGLAKVVGEPDEADVAEAGPPVAGDSLRTRIGTVFGTPGFMPPEQIRGEPVDAGSDVYALGATLYYTLARKPPHSTGSSDETLIAAERGPPEPLGRLVPGVPAELATIVDKALAYDQSVRYRDAAALAEDLEHFLAGQLVGAHRYSRRERFMRLVRRHRAAVAIAGLALAAIAIGSWIAIGRVIDERDRADAEAARATRGMHDAEQARSAERDRADQLLIYQAQQLARTSPTAAVAMIKQIATSPERWNKWWRQARAVVAEANVDGVAWGYEGPAHVAELVMSPSGSRAVAMGLTGDVWVYELATHHATKLGPYVYSSVIFAGDDHLLVSGPSRVTVVNLADRSSRTFDVPEPIKALDATARYMWWASATEVYRLDLATGTDERVAAANGTWRITISPDHAHVLLIDSVGAWLADVDALASPRRVVSGVLGISAWAPSSDAVALGAANKVAIVATTAANAPVRWIASPARFNAPVFASSGVLFVIGDAGLIAYADGRMVTRLTDPVANLDIVAGYAGNVVGSSGNVLRVVDLFHAINIVLPAERIDRLSARGGRYVLAASTGRVFAYDLAAMFPDTAVYPGFSVEADAGDHDFVGPLRGEWSWLDTDTKRFASIDLGRLTPVGDADQAVRGDSGYILSADSALYVFHRGGGRATKIASDAHLAVMGETWLAYANGAGQIIAYSLADGASTTLYASKAVPIAIALRGDRVAAAYADGTLWRLDRTTNAVETTRLEPAATNIELDLDNNGAVLVPDGKRALRWERDGRVTTLATLPTLVASVLTLDPERELIITTVDGAAYLMPADGSSPPSACIPAGTRNVISSPQRGLAAFPTGRGVGLFDLISGTHWPFIPDDRQLHTSAVRISRDGTKIAAQVDTSFFVWNLALPATAAETRAWLDQLTNASADLGPSALTWR